MDFFANIGQRMGGAAGGLADMVKSAASLDLSGVVGGLGKALTGGGECGQAGPGAAGNSLMERELQQLLASLGMNPGADGEQDEDQDDEMSADLNA